MPHLGSNQDSPESKSGVLPITLWGNDFVDTVYMLLYTMSNIILDPRTGFEPIQTESESVGLPLADQGMISIHRNTLWGQS